jgi:hypothetical protein
MSVGLRAMPARIALLGDKDLSFVTHRELDAAVDAGRPPHPPITAFVEAACGLVAR